MKVDVNAISGQPIQTPAAAKNSFLVPGNGTPAAADAVDIDKDLIFEDTEIKDDVFLLSRGDCNLFPLQNLSILKAQMKNGKTFAAALFASAYLAGTWERGEIQTATTPNGVTPDGAVIYIDTEQSPASTKKIRRRITKLYAIAKAGKTCTQEDYTAAADTLKDRLIVANVRAYNVEQRGKHIAAILARFTGARLVIIDGIKDICKDFNNIADVAACMDTVTSWALTYNVHILCILHENPSSDKARGHLGTELYNKATEIINVKRETDSNGTKLNNFRVTWEAIREGAGVNPFNFAVEDFGEIPAAVPRLCYQTENPETGTKTDAKTGAKNNTKTGAKPVQKNTGGQRFRTQNK